MKSINKIFKVLLSYDDKMLDKLKMKSLLVNAIKEDN